jgi:rRNA-processing protein FCF1
VTLVLEGRARAGADEAVIDGVEVVHAPSEADDTIAAIPEAYHEVLVVAADRALAERVRAANGKVVGRAGCSTSSWSEVQTDGP